MTEWISCPKCGALMLGFTGGQICPLCGYKMPAQTITATTGTSAEYVPVIRCRDCKFWGADGYRNGCKYATCIMMENDYCSMAERKEEWK